MLSFLIYIIVMFSYTAVVPSLITPNQEKYSSNIWNQDYLHFLIFNVFIYLSLNSTNPANSIITHKALRKYIRKFNFWATGLMTRKEKITKMKFLIGLDLLFVKVFVCPSIFKTPELKEENYIFDWPNKFLIKLYQIL